MNLRWRTGIGVAFCLLLLAAGSTVPATAQDGEVTVTEINLDRTTVEVGETVTVEGIVENDGAEPAATEVTLEVNGEAVENRTAQAVYPEFPVVARFEWTPREAGSYRIAINGVEAGNTVVVEAAGDGGGESGDDSSGGETTDAAQFAVRNVTFEPAEIEPGETTTVTADIGNDGDQPGDYDATLEVNGEPVRTETVPQVQPTIEVGAQQFFEFQPEEAGNYTISVDGVEADRPLVVEKSGGGGPLGFLPLDFLPLGLFGFLPLGLLRTVFLFVGLPLLLVYLALKALALYLGY